MKTVLAIAAHPDDIEFLMAGTMSLLAQRGYSLHYFNLADGCCGSMQHDAPTIARIRRLEAQRAAEALGATFHESICHDLEIFYDKPTLAKVASVIRAVRPTILLTHSPADYMEDHTNTCRLAVTAAFARGMKNFPVDPPREAYGDPVAVYHAQPYFHRDPLGKIVEPDIFVDVTDQLELKQALLAHHESQKIWLDESQGQGSYLVTMKELDAELGRMSGLFSYAEGWRRHLHIGFCNANDDPLREALRDRVVPGQPPTVG